MLLSKGVQKTRQIPMPNYGWGRDLMGVGLMRRILERTFLQFRGYFPSARYNPFQQINPDSQKTGYPD